jgi:lipopolysaccharide/colanic/teichoic acid biosynthesis glycosyltransferase
VKLLKKINLVGKMKNFNCVSISCKDAFIKRTFDIVVSSIILLLFCPIILIAFIAASIDTKKNGFFRQTRVGKDGRLFQIIKIRTMKEKESIITKVTTSNDPRITKLGSFLRKTKIDELPQLINVLLGQMSLVGPRPDVPGHADQLQGPDRVILTVRPGITGPATLKYRDEETLLAGVGNPEKYNIEVIYPSKVKINKEYIENYRFRNDILYIYKTIFNSR